MSSVPIEALCPSELAYAYKVTTDALLPLSPHRGGTIFDYSKISTYVQNNHGVISEQPSAYTETYTADSISDLSSQMTTSVETTASYASAFSASAKAEYGVSSTDNEERHFVRKSFYYRMANVTFPHYSTDLATLRELFTASFLAQLDGLTTEEQAKDFFSSAGTHFVSSVTLGGLYNYSANSVKTETTKTSDLAIAVNGKATGFGVSVGVSSSISVKDSDTEETYDATVIATVLGGDPTLVNDETTWRQSLSTRPGIIEFKITPIYKLVPQTDARYAVLKKATEAVLNPTNNIEVKWVTNATFDQNDAGSGADRDLSCYVYNEAGWYMLGHGYSQSMIVVKEGPLVKQATGWQRIWNDVGSGKSKDYDAYIPTCDDSNYVAMGVVYVFGSTGHSEPPRGMRVALVHTSAAQAYSLDHGESNIAWDDKGTGADKDLRVLKTPLGTTWPIIATYLGRVPDQFYCLTTVPEHPAATALHSLMENMMKTAASHA